MRGAKIANSAIIPKTMSQSVRQAGYELFTGGLRFG